MSQGKKTLTDVFTVVRNPELSTTHKVLWILIRSYSPTRGCFASAQTLAEHLGLSDTHVSRCRRELVAMGYLTRELRGPRPPVFHAVRPERVCTDDDSRRIVDVHLDVEKRGPAFRAVASWADAARSEFRWLRKQIEQQNGEWDDIWIVLKRTADDG